MKLLNKSCHVTVEVLISADKCNTELTNFALRNFCRGREYFLSRRD